MERLELRLTIGANSAQLSGESCVASYAEVGGGEDGCRGNDWAEGGGRQRHDNVLHGGVHNERV